MVGSSANNCDLSVLKVKKHQTTLSLLQSLITIEDGKMVHIQRWDGKETSLVREVNGNALTLVSVHTKSIHFTSVCVYRF